MAAGSGPGPARARRSDDCRGFGAHRSDQSYRRNLRNDSCPFGGPVRIVNRRAGAADSDVETVTDLNAVDGDLGTVFLMMRAGACVDWMETLPPDCSISGVVVYAGGFAEVGNLRDTRRMQRWATEQQVPVLGPQSLGFLTADAGVCAVLGTIPEAMAVGSVSVLCQSGGLMGGASRALLQRGVGVATAVSYGNGNVVGFADLAGALIEDETTRVILIHTEQLPDLRALLRLGQAAHDADKAVLLTLAGTSEAGQRAVVSHTAAVSTPRNLARCVCEQAGIIWMDDIDDMLDAAEALVSAGIPQRPRSGIGVFAGSGGGAIAIADALDAAGIPLNAPGERTVTELRRLGIRGTIGNPLDGGAGLLDKPEDYERQVQAFAKNPGYGIICKVIGSSAPTAAMPAQLAQYQQFVDIMAPLDKVPFLATPINQDTSDLVRWDGVAWGAGASRVAAKLRGLELWARYREYHHAVASDAPTVVAVPAPAGTSTGPLRVVTGPAASDLLPDLPVQLPTTTVLTGPDDLAAGEIASLGEVVLKSETGLNHRATAGAVIGPVQGVDQVSAGISLLAARWGYPVSVSSAVQHDIEWMVGFEYLEPYGWITSAGSGGVGAGAELQLYHGPLDTSGADILLRRSLGESRSDVVDLLLAIQNAGLSLPGFRSLEMNPVTLSRQGSLCALDVKLTFIDQTTPE